MNLIKYPISKSEAGQPRNVLTSVLFIIYLITLVWILLFKLGVRFSYMENRSVNLIPFGGSAISQGKIDMSELVLNALIFIPMGVYTGVLFKTWSFKKILTSIFLVSLLLESLQYIFRIGAFDSTDLITNTLGGVVGLILFQLIEKILNDSTKAQRFINIIASVGTLLVIVLLVLLKTNNLGIRYQ